MDKQLLEEVNRTREIMGLDILIEQEEPKTSELDAEGLEMQKTIEGVIAEIVDMFSQIDPVEREEFKKEVIGALKGDRFKVEDVDKEGVIKRLLDEFKKIEKQPIEESFLLERRRPNWKRWLGKTFGNLVNLLTLNLITFKKRYNYYTVWRKSWITIRHRRKAISGEMTSLDDMTPQIPENQWEEYFEKYNEKFKDKIVSGEDEWDASWDKYDEEEGDYPYRPVMIVAIEKWRSFDKRGRRKVKITVSDKPKVTKTKRKEKEPQFESKEIQFPKAGQPSADFFEDNEFAPTQAFKDNLQTEVIGPLQEIAKELNPPDGKPAFWLRTLGIATSCSARNNGQSSDGKTRTWVQLAEARAQAGLAYIKEQLATLNPPMVIGSNGGGQETEIVINSRGENFGKMAADNVRKLDGTSGPVWKEEGSPTDVADYEKYKYFNVAFDIIVNTMREMELPDEPDYDFVYTDKLAISYDIPPRKGFHIPIPAFKFKLPKIKWSFPFFSWFKGIFTKKPSLTKCPAFLSW